VPSYNRFSKNVPFRRGEITPEFQITAKIVDYTDRYRIDGIGTDSSVRSACSLRQSFLGGQVPFQRNQEMQVSA